MSFAENTEEHKWLSDAHCGSRWVRCRSWSYACVAGHKQGYRDGKALWDIMPLYHQVYLASDLLDRGATEVKTEVDEIASNIRREVVPEAWEDAGGNCTVKVFPENTSLVVGANNYVHEEVVKYVKAIRDERTMASASRVLMDSPSHRTDGPSSR